VCRRKESSSLRALGSYLITFCFLFRDYSDSLSRRYAPSGEELLYSERINNVKQRESDQRRTDGSYQMATMNALTQSLF